MTDLPPAHEGLSDGGLRTTCPYCGVGCGLVVSTDADGAIAVRGDKAHPANFGRLCSKGSALGETIGLQGRLLHPEVDGERVDWDTALDAVADRFRRVIEAHGPDAVAFYVSGQLLTEDYYVANKLMKGFIGSANIDTNSRLCMSSAVAAHKRAFGSDTVPVSYADLEEADLVVLVGSNLAWCHPVLYQRLLLARKARPERRFVVVDPRATASCDGAAQHLALRSGSDVVLFSGLLAWLQQHGHTDHAFVAAHTEGAEAALAAAAQYAPDVDAVAGQCGLQAAEVERFYRMFAATDRVVTVFSQGVNQSTSGVDKGNAIINCHLLTGRIGRPGAGPFSVTGQPNAMGGREVGGLANQLAAHMELEDPRHRGLVAGFWGVERVADRPGLKAVELFEAVERGDVKALWVMATNPAVSLPDSSRVRRALARCDCLVVSDCVAATDTLAFADIRLPALAWGEKDGTVTNSERVISRQRAFLPPPGEARPDWWIVSEVGRRMGYAGFGYASAAQVFAEHAALSGHANDGTRDFDISALAGLDARGYRELEPVQWPIARHEGPGGRLFGDGRFFTPSGRARLVALTPRPPAARTDPGFPLVLNTGRIRDQWHTMTRTGRSPRLSGHLSEPFVDMHPADAAAVALREGDLATLMTRHGEALVRVRLTDAQPAGQVFAPMHWNDQYAAAARIGSLIGADVDGLSGQPEFKHTPVRVVPYRAAWHGFLLTRDDRRPPWAAYWSKSRRRDAWQYELAGESPLDDWPTAIRDWLGEDPAGAEWRELCDSTHANYRAARIVDGRLDMLLIVAPERRLPPRDWLAGLFASRRLSNDERGRLLRGTPPGGQPDGGAIVCSCFGIGLKVLQRTIREHGLGTPEAIGEVLGAGTNCGSCLPELRRLIADAVAEPAAGG